MFPAASTATAMGLTWQVRLSGLGSDDGSGGAATLVHAADGKVMYSVVAPVTIASPLLVASTARPSSVSAPTFGISRSPGL